MRIVTGGDTSDRNPPDKRHAERDEIVMGRSGQLQEHGVLRRVPSGETLLQGAREWN